MALNDSPVQIGDGSSWLIDSTTWDTITIAGVDWHGAFDIKGAKRFYKWDTKDAPGAEGWFDTYRGRKPKPFKIMFEIWTDLMWTNWKLFSQAFIYNGIVGLVIPVDIYHPSLAAIGISKVVCEEIGNLEVNRKGDKSGVVEITLREYSGLPPPVNATTSPKSAAGTNAKPPGNPAVSAEAALLHAQLYTLKSLNAIGGTPGGIP